MPPKHWTGEVRQNQLLSVLAKPGKEVLELFGSRFPWHIGAARRRHILKVAP